MGFFFFSVLIISIWIVDISANSVLCNSTMNSNTDRYGSDYDRITLPNNATAATCLNYCCSQDACLSWAFAKLSNVNSCFLKAWVPDIDSSTGVTSGVKAIDMRAPPPIPAIFKLLANIQSTNNSISWESTCWYVYEEGKFACYSNNPSGTTEIQLYRYDTKLYYDVQEVPNKNGLKITCRNSSLSGSLFPPGLLSDFAYKGESDINGERTGVFSGTLPTYGSSTWYSSQTNPPIIRRILLKNYQIDIIQFEAFAYVPSSVFHDPITLCQ